MSSKNVVILGAGLAGLSAGWVLAKKGYQVDIIERENFAGGLAITKSGGGYSWDLGPHNIHTGHSVILSFLKRAFPAIYEHSITSTILKAGIFVPYPLQGVKILTSLPVIRLVAASFSFLFARIRMFISDPLEDGSFETWIRNRFGGVLFKEYFSDYPKKVWGIPTHQIDKHVGEKRIPILGLVELIRTALFKAKPRIDHPEFKNANYYLPNGIGEMAQFFEREFKQLGGRIHFQSELAAVRSSNGLVTQLEYRGPQGNLSLPCDYLLSTVPLDSFIQAFDHCPQPVSKQAQQLDYVASVLLFIKLKRRDVIPSKLLYFSNPETKFSRISDMAMFSNAMVPEGRSLLCCEFPCTSGDDVWNLTTESLEKHVYETLNGFGMLEREDIEGSFVERVSHSYPRFRVGFQQRLNECQRFLASFSNVLSYGRQGGFSYVNTDSVIRLGFHAADAVIIASSMGYSCSEWFTNAIGRE